MATTTNDEIDFDISQLDDTLISDTQKQTLLDYINQLKNQKTSLHEEYNQFKSSTGSNKRRRTKRQINSSESNVHLQTMLETLIYIVHEINLEQIKLTTTINQLVQRINQNELYLNQLNINIENFYQQYHNKQTTDINSLSLTEENSSQPIDMSRTGTNYQSTKTERKSNLNKEYIELGDPSIGLSCLVLKRKYDQVRRRTELAYIHGEKRAIGRLLTFLIRQFFSNDELRNASLDGRVRNTQALAKDRMKIIDEHLQTIFGIDYNLYRLTKDCAEQVNVVCRHARNPKNFYDNQTKISDHQFDEYETFQEELFIQANEQRFHELSQEYENVRNEVVQQREIENQLKQENEQLKNTANEIEKQLAILRQNEQQLQTKLETTIEQVRQITLERDQLKNLILDKEREVHDLQKQYESLEEENRQVHQTNTSTIAHLQELESTRSQLQSLESLWNKERQLYTEQIQTFEQSLIESKKQIVDQQMQIMQLSVQLESTDGQLQAQKRSLDSSIEEKNQSIHNLDRQLREKNQKIEQFQIELQRINRQNENQQLISNKTIQSLKTQIDELTRKTITLTEQSDEQNQLITKLTSERDILKIDIRTLTETYEKQTIENEQTIRRLQDELDNTTQLLESIRSKGADLTQLTNFLDGTLSHIRSNEQSSSTLPPTTNCSECRQLKSALVLELTGKERFRFGYEQLSSMIKEAAPILRRQKQDYEASFEVIAKLTSELNEARKELSELHQLSGESIENYRYIQRENQCLINDNKSLATKIQVLLSEIEQLRTGQHSNDDQSSTDIESNQQIPLTFRNIVELQHVNQKLDKLVREMRAQNENNDEDLNRKRFEELKREHQQQQDKFKETKTQLDSLETQMNSLIQERDFLRLLVSRSSSTQNTSITNQSIDNHQVENLRDQINRLQDKLESLTKKNLQLTNEKDELIRISNEKVRSIQYELLTARTEVEQVNEKFNILNDELATSKLTIASLQTEIHSWQERHSTLIQIRNKQEQQYFHILTELRQIKDEKTLLDCRLNTLENAKKFDTIKYEQIESECQLLKNEIIQTEQLQPVINKLQILAEYTKEKMKSMFETKLNDLINENHVLNQRIEQNERDKELIERQYQTRLDELIQNLNQEKHFHQEYRTNYIQTKEKAEQLENKLNDIENRLTSNTTQKTDFEQQLGDYEKELKILRVKLDAANNELELKQNLIQSNNDNINQINLQKQKEIDDLEKTKQECIDKLTEYENEMTRLKQDLYNSQLIANENKENLRIINERIQTLTDQHQTELLKLNQQIEQYTNEKNQYLQQIEQISIDNEQLNQLKITFEQQQLTFEQSQIRINQLHEQITSLQTSNQRLLDDIQQYELRLVEKDQTIQTQQDLIQQTEQRFIQLEQKHTEQHQLMIKLSTHLAAKESETPTPTTTTDTNVNETWNTILSMNNYLRVENTRLIDDLERIRLENAHLNERYQTIEQLNQVNQQIIDELKFKNQSFENLQLQYDQDQEQIQNLQDKCLLLEQNNQTYEFNLTQLNNQHDNLKEKLEQTEIKDKFQEEQLMIKTTELDELKGKITKLESDNQELKLQTTKLRQIAIKYREMANAAVPSAQNPPTTTTTPPTTTETEDLFPGGASEAPSSTRSLPVDLTEKMNKLRDALVAARTKIGAQQTRLTQMTNELVRVKQSRISIDLTEVHALVDSIRQTYEAEINDLKQIIQLFDSADSNEHMTEILRLRKKIEDIQATKSVTTISEDVTPKPARPQAFAPHTTQEPVISRVVPMAPATGRQIGVATPMTASTTATTTSAPLWTTASTPTESTSAQIISPVDHPTTQLSTPAGVNLLMKRSRTDDGEQRSMESTVKRTRPETETAPLIAHVEPQVREQQQQQQQQTTVQETTEAPETNILDTQRIDVVPNPIESEVISSSIEETPSNNPENDFHGTNINVPSTTITTNSETTLTTTTTTTIAIDSTNITTTEQPTEQRRGDILPIIYDVQTIPTIGSGGLTQANRGGLGRQRPLMSISANRRTWPARGAGSGRGPGARGAGPGGVGPSARQ